MRSAPAWLRVGIDKDSVDDAEDSGGGADAEGQVEDGDGGGDPALGQQTDREADVLED
jgi:hypothetical protein